MLEEVIKKHIRLDKYHYEYIVALPQVLSMTMPAAELPDKPSPLIVAVYRFVKQTGVKEFWYEFVGVEVR